MDNEWRTLVDNEMNNGAFGPTKLSNYIVGVLVLGGAGIWVELGGDVIQSANDPF